MTPALLGSAALRIKPYASRLAWLALGSLLAAFALLALGVSVLDDLYTPLALIALPLAGLSIGSLGALMVVALYAHALPPRGRGGLAALDYGWNRLWRALFAPLITLWFAALALILLGGLVLGVLHLAAWAGLA